MYLLGSLMFFREVDCGLDNLSEEMFCIVVSRDDHAWRGGCVTHLQRTRLLSQEVALVDHEPHSTLSR
jgi:hypothetical protein